MPGPQACAKSLFAVRIVGAGFIPPGHFPPPQTATAARGLAALQQKRLPLRGCARRRVSERNRRRRLLARRLKLSPKVTDEGRRYRSHPFTGNNGSAAPHPASVGASATFPPRGRLFLYLLILSISASSSAVKLVFCTALMLSRICCVLDAPISTVVISSWLSSHASAISASV